MVQRLTHMQRETDWLVHDVVVPRGVLAAASAAAARRQLEDEEHLAMIGELSQLLDERPGTAAASELLERVSGAMTASTARRNGNENGLDNDDGLDNDNPNLVPGGGFGKGTCWAWEPKSRPPCFADCPPVIT